MTETRDDVATLSKLTDTKRIIEQIENCRTGLLREILAQGVISKALLESQNELLKETIAKHKQLNDLKTHGFVIAILMILMLAILLCSNLSILNKLTALGL